MTRGKNDKTATAAQVDSIEYLFLIHRVDAYTATTLHKMIVLDRLLKPAKSQFVEPAKDAYRRVKVPESWLDYLKELRDQEITKDTQLKAADLRNLWIGLYYYQAF